MFTRARCLSLFRCHTPFGLFLLLLLCSCTSQAQNRPAERLRNPGFEGGGGSDGRGAGVPGWDAFELGYDVDRNTFRGGEQSIRCDSLRATTLRGASSKIVLNQKQAIPVEVTGWSKAEKVSGVRDSDYSLYVDLTYTDGTNLWGTAESFRVGTHDWERRHLLIVPKKPIEAIWVFALFRKHTGTAWFDDFAVHQLDGPGIFDSQSLLPLPKRETHGSGGIARRVSSADGLTLGLNAQSDIVSVKAGGQEITSTGQGGFYLRDVGADGPILPLNGTPNAYKNNGLLFRSDAADQQVRFFAQIVPEGDALAIDGELTDLTGKDRAFTVYFALPVGAEGWTWGDDIRRSHPIAAGQEYSNLTHTNVGATGGLSLYPFGAVSQGKAGVALANRMDWPAVTRIFYNGTTRQLVMAWDMALTPKTVAWPGRNARFRALLYRLPPESAAWGFRAAAQKFYRLNAPNFDRFAKADGIWMPFTDPGTIKNAADFGFTYHEGDNSIKTDDAAGILSFRYTEPMTWWMPMPPAMPRTYENAMAMVNSLATDPHPKSKTDQDLARAVLNSGTQDENGHYNLEFRNEPWANGAVFVMDTNPELAATPDRPTRAYLDYNTDMAMKMYGAEAKRTRGDQDGEYLDSLEGWSDVQDYRPSDIAANPYPLPFDTDSRRPVLPQWYSTHTFARFLRDDLHNRGKLLMANSVPIRFSVFAPLFDVMGIEVNWLDPKGEWQPEGDDILSMRRTLSATKPYLLLMNTNFDKFSSPMVEKYFQRSLFYGIFPSMFSADAATHPYWESPALYERDRPLFRKYIPVIRKLSAAGWEPITQAKSSNASVYVERYGKRLVTVLNDSRQPANTTLTIDLTSLGLGVVPTPAVVDLLTGAKLPVSTANGVLTLTVSLKPDQALALELR
ncbi:MAG: hypothetical protein JWL77_596 [Chthonomonadaceae bacterium]|nr:hypothetical protein [Chthonomonadaceae bacterium]